MVNEPADVYLFADRVKSAAEAVQNAELTRQIDDAMRLGSSSLEVLGAIREIVISNTMLIHELLGDAGKFDSDQVVAFVDRIYGR